MHTSLSKKLLAGLLSLVMVLSLVAPGTSAQAATKYSLTDKKSVKSGVTFKYQLKGVSKNQYVKVTRNVSGEKVVYNKKSLTKTTKINGTGKTLNLYVTYGDKVANYTGKFTVKIYNKKTNKVVKTIVEKTTVKVTPLEITSVEAATREDDGNVKYLLVQFNKALDSLDASEVTIRRDRDDQLYTVSSVALAKNGKSATITLLGNDQAGTTHYLYPLTDYTLKVSQNGATASLGFNIPEFRTGIVTSYDAAKETITVSGTKIYAEGFNLDYFDLLGKEVDVKFDVNQKLINLSDRSTKTIYGSFYSALRFNADGSLNIYSYDDPDAEYVTQPTTIGDNVATSVYTYGTYADDVVGENLAAGYANYLYAKIVLNPNGTVKEIIATPIPASETWVLVKEVNGNYINGYDAATNINVQYYTVIKDNKIVSLADVAKDDVVFVNSAAKTVVIYDSVEEVAVKSVYTDRVVLGESTVKYTDASGYDLSGTKVFMDNKLQDTSNATKKEIVFNTLKAGGNVKVYYTFDGHIAFITGTAGEVKTNTSAYIITEQFASYSLKNANYIYATLSNGSKTLKLDILTNQLNFVKDGSANDIVKTSSTDKIDISGTAGASNGLVKLNAGGTGINLNALIVGQLIYVTTNANGDVVGLEIPAITNKVSAAEDFSKNPALGTVTKLVTSTSTPLFEVDATNKVVVATTLGEYSKVLDSASTSYVVADATNAKLAGYIVVFKSELASTSTIKSTKQYVVQDLITFTNADGNKEIESVKVVEIGSEEVTTLTKFVDPTESAMISALVPYTIVELGFDDNGNIVKQTDSGITTLSGANLVASPVAISNTQDTITIGTTTYEFYSASDYTSKIYEIQSDGSLALISWSDLTTYADYMDIAYLAQYKGVTSNVIGTMVVSFNGSSNNVAADKAAISATDSTSTTAALAKTAITTAATNGTVTKVVVKTLTGGGSNTNVIVLTVTFKDGSTKDVTCNKITDADYATLTVGLVL